MTPEESLYKLKLPKEIQKRARKLADLAGEELDLSSEMIRYELDSTEKKIRINLKFPKSSEPDADWDWFSFSAPLSSRVQEILRQPEARIFNPHFYTKTTEGEEPEYYIRFQLHNPAKQGDALEESREEGSEGWGKSAKAAVVLLFLVFASLVITAFPGMPFRIVASDSMEPTLEKGTLVHTRSPEEVEAGDIVVIDVPSGYQERYGYPSRIIHRVVEVDGKYLKTAGDASGPDPFKSNVSTVTGAYTGFKMPKVGYIFLFLQTLWGRVYAVIVIGTLILYSTLPSWLEKKRRKEERMRKALRSTIETRSSLVSFSSAMDEYATHLKSHTSAIQNLAKTTKHLDRVVSELEEENAKKPREGDNR